MNRKQLVRAAIIALSLGAMTGTAAAQDTAARYRSPLAQKILGPQAPAAPSAATTVSVPRKVAKRKKVAAPVRADATAPAPAGTPSRDSVSYAKGSIVGLRSGTLVLAVGQKIVDIALGPGTVVKTAKGRMIELSSLRKGERVKVTYRSKGARAGAASISIVS